MFLVLATKIGIFLKTNKFLTVFVSRDKLISIIIEEILASSLDEKERINYRRGEQKAIKQTLFKNVIKKLCYLFEF